MTVRWLSVSVLLIFLLPAVACAAAPPTEARVQGDLGLAKILLRSGLVEPARALLQADAKLSPTDPEVWFLLGMSEQEAGDNAAAVDAFRRCAHLDPTKPRALLEMGKSLTNLHRYQEARDAFEDALDIVDNRTVRRNINKYINIINNNEDFTYWISGSVQPDTNPSVTSGQKTVSIHGIRFALNNPQRETGGFGLGVVAGGRYAPWINKHWRSVSQIEYAGVHFLRSCCSDETVGAASGIGLWGSSYHVLSQAYARYRIYAGSGYSTEEGLRLEVGISRPDYKITTVVEGGPSRLVQPDLFGSVWRAVGSIDIPINPNWSVATTLSYERDSYTISSQSFNTKSIEENLSFLGLFKFPTQIWASYTRRNFDSATLTSDGIRVDDEITGGVAVSIDTLMVWGVSPTIGLVYNTESSNDPLGRFNRLQAILGLSKTF